MEITNLMKLWDASHGATLAFTAPAGTGSAPASTGTAFGVPGAAPAPSTPQAGANPTTAAPGGPAQPVPKQGGSGLELFIPMIVVLVALMGMSVLAGRKEKKKRQALFESLKRNDKVMTHSGIIGTITEIGAQDVVLKVEDGRIRFSRSAIQTVIDAAAGTTSDDKTKEPALSDR